MTDRNPSKATRATLERLAEALYEVCERDQNMRVHIEGTVRLQKPWAAYRSETQPKLRSRADVDAEIGVLVRTCVDHEWAGDDDPDIWDRVTALCREPTREPEAECEHVWSVPGPGNTPACIYCFALRPDADHPVPEAAGCPDPGTELPRKLCARKDCAIFGPHTHYELGGYEGKPVAAPRCVRCDRTGTAGTVLTFHTEWRCSEGGCQESVER